MNLRLTPRAEPRAMERRRRAPKRGLMGGEETTVVADPNQTPAAYHVAMKRAANSGDSGPLARPYLPSSSGGDAFATCRHARNRATRIFATCYPDFAAPWPSWLSHLASRL